MSEKFKKLLEAAVVAKEAFSDPDLDEHIGYVKGTLKVNDEDIEVVSLALIDPENDALTPMAIILNDDLFNALELDESNGEDCE